MIEYHNQKHCPECDKLAVQVITQMKHVGETADLEDFPRHKIDDHQLLVTNDDYSYSDTSLPMLVCSDNHKWYVSKDLVHYVWTG